MSVNTPSVEEVLYDPATSNWLKDALIRALKRDPVDAANDAALLNTLLNGRLKEILPS